MPVLNTGLAKTSAGGYTIDYSCRFNGTDTMLERTPSSTGNRRMLTFSAWIKQGDVGTTINGNYIFAAGVNGDGFVYQSGQLFRNQGYGGSAGADTWWGTKDWEGFQRDAGGWKHIVLRFDTEQDAEEDRIRLFINGVEPPLEYIYHLCAEDYDLRYNHTADAHWIGAMYTWGFFDGYMAEVHWIDGAIVSPNAFGEFGDYGEWKPKEYVVDDYAAYGTNGFYLDFADSSHFGNDVSGNGNDFTDTGFGTQDQMLDTPTNNFPTWNPLSLDVSGTGTISLEEGNLKNLVHNDAGGKATMLIPETGKWYWEVNMADVGLNTASGIADDTGVSVGNGSMATNGRFGYFRSGNAVGDGSYATFGDSFTDGDILGVAFDVDNEALYFAKNGIWQNSGDPTSGASKTGAAFTTTLGSYGNYVPVGYGAGGDSIFIANFGQDSSFAGEETAQGNQDGNGIGDFYYTPPSGFLALCTSNLPAVAVIPSEHFDVALYTGDSSVQSITSLGFQPDFTWIKERSDTANHQLFDAVRGVINNINTNATTAETTNDDTLTHFLSNGFTTGDDNRTNMSGETYVAWNWKANGAGSSNENGSINTTATSANVDAGFSISTYTGTGSAATIGHGLSKAPEMIIVKERSGSESWGVYHASNTAAPETERLLLNTDYATSDSINYWSDTAPTADVFTVHDNAATNGTDATYVAYCFHSVDGFSKVGSYEGNGAADGTFIYTGFRPAFVLIKSADSTSDWMIFDSKREGYNVDNNVLLANTTAVETTTNYVDLLSNGFKCRITTDPNVAETYIYYAIAETPFRYANAR